MTPVGILALAFTAATGAVLGGVPDAVGSGGFYVDLLNLQWWQALLAGAVALGLSPAPWITALATGRLLFRADLERQLKAKDEEHARAMAQAEAYYQGMRTVDKDRYDELKVAHATNVLALEAERSRSDEVTEGLLGVGAVVEANTHVLQSFHGAVTDLQAGNDQ